MTISYKPSFCQTVSPQGLPFFAAVTMVKVEGPTKGSDVTMGELFSVIGRLLCIAGGLGLIVLVIMWFGAVPLVACIFDAAFSGWQLIVLLAMMIVVIGLIVKFIINR